MVISDPDNPKKFSNDISKKNFVVFFEILPSKKCILSDSHQCPKPSVHSENLFFCLPSPKCLAPSNAP